MSDYDVAIIGGGLAGASAGFEAARRGMRCLLLEKGDFPRDKVCGEFYSAEGVDALGRMAPEVVAAAPRITTAAFYDSTRRRALFSLPRPALGISRLRLDAALWQAAAAAGCDTLAKAQVRSVRRASDGDHLQWSGGEATARHLIVAAGRWWSIPGLREPATARAQARATPWIGVKARFTGVPTAGNLEMYFFRGGYCGLAPVENGWTNACCHIHRERAGDLATARDFAAWIGDVSAHPILQDRLRTAVQATPTVSTAPVWVGPKAARLGEALVVGDAAGFVDPFTGDGMARAVLSGRLAASVIAAHPHDAAAVYAASLQKAIGRSFGVAQLFRCCLPAPPWLHSAALRLLSVPGAGARALAATRWSAAPGPERTESGQRKAL